MQLGRLHQALKILGAPYTCSTLWAEQQVMQATSLWVYMAKRAVQARHGTSTMWHGTIQRLWQCRWRLKFLLLFAPSFRVEASRTDALVLHLFIPLFQGFILESESRAPLSWTLWPKYVTTTGQPPSQKPQKCSKPAIVQSMNLARQQVQPYGNENNHQPIICACNNLLICLQSSGHQPSGFQQVVNLALLLTCFVILEKRPPYLFIYLPCLLESDSMIWGMKSARTKGKD